MYIGSDHIQSFLDNRDTIKIEKQHSNSMKVVFVEEI